jgi:hypothetical protein
VEATSSGQNKRAIFEPNRVAIETVDGAFIEAHDNPEELFAGQQRETPWNDVHVIYFVGERCGPTSMSRLHGGYSWRGNRPQLCLGLP